ncbi:PIN domain-containing protein [Kitasatospora sp. NPDC059599]|uniref:PIN domain-containing protein n=1 Tax=Kitasatospora sp. NPDC059599 TaxID=3346880 RepID=UPI00368A330A
MIIFDTNAVNRIDPRSPRADIVRALRASGQHRVGIPGTVLEELVAHKAKDYMAQREATVSALKSLREMAPWRPADAFGEPVLELEACQEHWRALYSELFEVVPTSGGAALKALSREALALPPAKQGEKRAEGARDAAIWFTVLGFLREFADEEVHFVTNNTKDFGDGTAYRFPMDQDLGDCADRLKRLKDFDAVVTAFTTPVNGSAADADAKRYLGSESMATTIGSLALGSHRAAPGFAGITTSGDPVEWNAWTTAPRTTLLSTGKAVGHRIGQEVWYTAETTWLLYGLAAAAGRGLEGVACVWHIKLLFSSGGDGDQGVPTLLSSGDPSAPDLQDQPTADALAALHKEVLSELVSQGRRGTADNAGQQGRPASSTDVATVSGFDASSVLADAARAAAHPTVDLAAVLAASRATTQARADAVWTLANMARTTPGFDLQAFLAASRAAARARIDVASALPDYTDLASALTPQAWACNHAALAPVAAPEEPEPGSDRDEPHTLDDSES